MSREKGSDPPPTPARPRGRGRGRAQKGPASAEPTAADAGADADGDGDEDAEDAAAKLRLLALLGGKWLTAAISAAATLGLPDALARRPMRLADLSRELACDRVSLGRLVRVLIGENLLRENDLRELELTKSGALLCSDALGDLARYVGAPFNWDPWSNLPHAIRSGESAFAKHHGMPLFDYLDHHDGEASLYHSAIDAFARHEAQALATAYDFGDTRSVADVGGGKGTLLVEVLQRWPHLSGLLLDRPTAVREAREAFEAAGLSDRCAARVTDFQQGLPTGADVCVVKHVIHNWDDETATALLASCRDAVGADGKVLVIEGVVLPGGRQNLTNLLDLEMLVLLGPGRERSKPDLRRLFSAAGLRLESSRALTGSALLFVTSPKPT